MTLQSTVHSLPIRCRVCRDRDWQAGGPGRADRIGHAILEDGRLFVQKKDRDSRDKVLHAVTAPSDFRVRCRRGRRIDATLEEIRVEFDRAVRMSRDAVYL